MRRLVLAAVLVGLPSLAYAAPRWTFCLAASGGGADVWISQAFAADRSRDALESAFKAAIEKLGAKGGDAHCPSPRDDEEVAADARSQVETFNRRLGATIHAVSACEFTAPPPAQSGRVLQRQALADH